MTAPISSNQTQMGGFTPIGNPPAQGTFTPFTKDDAAKTLTAVDSTTGAPIGNSGTYGIGGARRLANDTYRWRF